MSKINILDEHMINLIAAGEVIERMASVVKELVENSIDAGSTKIVISLIEAGYKEITVSDNGCGMDELDMKKAILPHATSKIKDPNDLFSINTLGFRGEALASIVAVSNVKIKSSTDGKKGFMLGIRAGEINSVAYIGHPKGTDIQVRDLFYNTPARLQNLKSVNQELSYTIDYVHKIAMANPHISFKLINNDNVIFSTFGNGIQLEVINSVYGLSSAKNMITIADSNHLFKVCGSISNLSITRSNKNNITIIVNGRVVKNSNVVNAIIEGYKTLLTVGRYPICVIEIFVDYSLVDVNVHPTKSEVRFSDEKVLLDLITDTISKTLLRSNLIVNNDTVEDPFTLLEEDLEDEEDAVLNFNENESENQSNDNVKPEVNLFNIIDEENLPIAEKSTNAHNLKNEDLEDKEDLEDEEEFDEEDLEDDDEYNDFNIFNSEDELDEFENKVINFEEVKKTEQIDNKETNIVKDKKVEQVSFDFVRSELTNTSDDSEIDKIIELHYVGQLFGTYLLCQNNEYFYLIDQHAANERINYEKIINELKKSSVVNYELLLPINLTFTSSESLLINDKIDIINSLGISLDEFGGGSFVVRSVPLWIKQNDVKEYVEDIIMQVIREKKSTKEEFLDGISKSLACKRSIKANEFMSPTQISYLLEDLIKCENPYTCPHGRPIIIKYSRNQVEKWFKRT